MSALHTGIHRYALALGFAGLLLCGRAAAESAPLMTVESSVNWIDNSFTSDITFDVQTAGIPIPSGKKIAVNRMNTQLPVLIKDALLAIPVDSVRTLEDMVRDKTISLAEITGMVDSSRGTPSVFTSNGRTLTSSRTLDLKRVGASLVRHRVPSSLDEPIDRVSSRAYTGIVIDARGALPVHGEFIEAQGAPCLFPAVWDENMDRLYDKNQAMPSIARERGIVRYDYSDDLSRYSDLVGADPLRITAREIYGVNRTDPVISREDALRILSIPENRQILRDGRIVILLDEDQLMHKASAPVKDEAYYESYRNIRQYVYENRVPDVKITDRAGGLEIRMENLQFVADSAELLPDEAGRLDAIAEMLKQELAQNDFTIMVAGHTASVGKPQGEMTLSIQRAQAIIAALVARGIDANLFTYRGYGGTLPLGDNNTPEGRAMNRRVEITAVPRTDTVMQDWVQRE